jgi:hypothetical protein
MNEWNLPIEEHLQASFYSSGLAFPLLTAVPPPYYLSAIDPGCTTAFGYSKSLYQIVCCVDPPPYRPTATRASSYLQLPPATSSYTASYYGFQGLVQVQALLWHTYLQIVRLSSSASASPRTYREKTRLSSLLRYWSRSCLRNVDGKGKSSSGRFLLRLCFAMAVLY